MSRTALVMGNWKMHHDHTEALHCVRDLGLRLKPEDVAHVEVALCPPFTDLRTVQTVIEAEHLPIRLGAQHCNPADSGAFTGEVSAGMLAKLGVHYVLVGHSERRREFGMDDDIVGATARAVIRHGMVPVVCVGETGEERQSGATRTRLAAQLEVLKHLRADHVVIAYEPVWAIGTGESASPIDAQDAGGYIREVAGKHFEGDVRILYGGSVSEESAADLVGEPDIDGLLVGGASLDAGSYTDIVRAVGGCYREAPRKD